MQKTRSAKKTVHKPTINNSVDDIRDHANGMSDSVRDIGDAVKNLLLEKAVDMLKRAISFSDRGQLAAKGAIEDVRDKVEEKIEEKPYHAVLIAAGIGLLVGFVLRRR